MTAPRTRQERAADTRVRLYEAAARMFASDGYHATTVARIAAAAGVAKGTFFIHFATKDAVIGELVRLQVEAARATRAQALTVDGPVEALKETVLELARQAGKSRSVSRAVLIATMESAEAGERAGSYFDGLLKTMVEDARAGQKAGALAEGIDPKTLASVLMASYLGAALHFTSTPKSPPLVDLLRPLLDANLAGLRNQTPSRRSSTRPEPRVRARRSAR